MGSIIYQTLFDRDPGLEIKGIDSKDKRTLALLLYEISFMSDLSGITDGDPGEEIDAILAKLSLFAGEGDIDRGGASSSINGICERRNRIVKEIKGLRPGDVLIDPERLKKRLTRVYEIIEERYADSISMYKVKKGVSGWTPPPEATLKYFRYWLRRYAGKLLREAKG